MYTPNFVLIGKPYNPDLVKLTNSDEWKVLVHDLKTEEIKLKKAKQNFAFIGLASVLYGVIVHLSRKS